MIDELLAELAEAGWLINNLYQVDGGLWRANLRRPDGEGDWFTVISEGSTAYDALMESYAVAASAEFTHTTATETFTEKQIGTLLSRLGLTRKTPFTDRRL